MLNPPGTPLAEAWWRALYGPTGFYRRERPAQHFRTASHAAAPQLAQALARLALEAGCRRIVDVGAGAGELLTGLADRADTDGLDLVGVELRPRPDAPTLLIGWELLDVLPCPVLGADPDGGLRELLVGPAGEFVLGAAADPRDLAWCRAWWPGPWPPGSVVEVGRARDEFWAALVDGHEGLALAVDYDHLRAARPRGGTLLGYRDGLARAPELDGSMDLTAHVALDAVAARVGPAHLLARQTRFLTALIGRPVNPPHELAGADPLGYLRELDRAGRHRELLDPAGLGGFGWLLSARGTPAERVLACLAHRLGPPS